MVKLQAKFNKKTLKYVLLNLRMNIAQTNFISRCKKKGLGFVAKLAKRNDEIANTCMVLCGDMEFNLNPASAAYRNNNKDVEKAIYCAEALARMPQQKIKWGAEITRFFAPHLYRVFYAVVIKEEYHFHRALTGEKFQLSTKKRRKGLFK